MSAPWSALTALTGLATAACGGAFLTWSTFNARALAALPASAGLAAMQQVNLAAPRSPAFMGLIFVPALACVALGVRAAAHPTRPGSALTLVGAAVYVLGVAGMTVAFHVPRNNALAVMDPAADADRWAGWLRVWVAGNHVRTLSGLVAGTLLLLASRRS